MIGICKELAPTAEGPRQVLTDEALGVGEYHEKFFGLPNPLYVDTDMGFYNAFGRKKITSQLSWNPFWIGWKLITNTYRFIFGDLAIAGNLAGEGAIVGGLMVVLQDSGSKLAYHVLEPLDGDFNYEEIKIATACKGEVPSGNTEGTFLSYTEDAPTASNG